jgi:hypothetical protein
MSFEPQNDLERSLINAANDPAHRPQFYKDFVKSDIFVIHHGKRPPEKDGKLTLDEGADLQTPTMQFHGKPYIPIFSSLARLQASVYGEVACLAINALEFLKMTAGSALILNPGPDFAGKEITPEEAAAIVDGSVWQPNVRYVAPKEIQAMIGPPKNYPDDLLEALARFFATKEQVKRAWVAHFFNPDRDEKPHTLIAVEVSDGFDEVTSEAGIVARHVIVPDPPVDFLQITGRGGLEDYFVKDTTPFFERRLLGPSQDAAQSA